MMLLKPSVMAAMAALAGMAVGRSEAVEFLPLEVGRSWTYDSVTFAEHEKQVVVDSLVILDTVVYRIRYMDSTYNEGLENLWRSREDGDVELWGAHQVDWDVYYVPPVLMVDAPLASGKEWTQTSEVFSLPDSTYYDTMQLTFRVVEEGMVTVPLGQFHAFGIWWTASGPGGSSSLRSLRGENRPAGAEAPIDWWAEGVGQVQYMASDLYQLSAMEGPVNVKNITWSGIKRRPW